VDELSSVVSILAVADLFARVVVAHQDIELAGGVSFTTNGFALPASITRLRRASSSRARTMTNAWPALAVILCLAYIRNKLLTLLILFTDVTHPLVKDILVSIELSFTFAFWTGYDHQVILSLDAC
jgi:hypothetical protein